MNDRVVVVERALPHWKAAVGVDTEWEGPVRAWAEFDDVHGWCLLVKGWPAGVEGRSVTVRLRLVDLGAGIVEGELVVFDPP